MSAEGILVTVREAPSANPPRHGRPAFLGVAIIVPVFMGNPIDACLYMHVPYQAVLRILRFIPEALVFVTRIGPWTVPACQSMNHCGDACIRLMMCMPYLNSQIPPWGSMGHLKRNSPMGCSADSTPSNVKRSPGPGAAVSPVVPALQHFQLLITRRGKQDIQSGQRVCLLCRLPDASRTQNLTWYLVACDGRRGSSAEYQTPHCI